MPASSSPLVAPKAQSQAVVRIPSSDKVFSWDDMAVVNVRTVVTTNCTAPLAHPLVAREDQVAEQPVKFALGLGWF